MRVWAAPQAAPEQLSTKRTGALERWMMINECIYSEAAGLGDSSESFESGRFDINTGRRFKRAFLVTFLHEQKT